MLSRIFTAATVVLALGSAGFAQDATQGADEEAPKRSLSTIEAAPGISNETLSDEKVRAFVQAMAAVRVVSQRFVPMIEAETDGAKRAEMMDNANNAIVRAIDLIANITPAEYKAIDIAAQQDEALSERILADIKKAGEEGRAAAAAAKAEAEAANEAEAAEQADGTEKTE